MRCHACDLAVRWRARRDSNPNLLIRRPMESVQPVRQSPDPQVRDPPAVQAARASPVLSAQSVRKL